MDSATTITTRIADFSTLSTIPLDHTITLPHEVSPVPPTTTTTEAPRLVIRFTASNNSRAGRQGFSRVTSYATIEISPRYSLKTQPSLFLMNFYFNSVHLFIFLRLNSTNDSVPLNSSSSTTSSILETTIEPVFYSSYSNTVPESVSSKPVNYSEPMEASNELQVAELVAFFAFGWTAAVMCLLLFARFFPGMLPNWLLVKLGTKLRNLFSHIVIL